MVKPLLPSFCVMPLITLLLCLLCLPVYGRIQQVSPGSCTEIPGAWDASRGLRNISAASSAGSDLQDTSTRCQPGVEGQDPWEQDLFCPQHWVCFWALVPMKRDWQTWAPWRLDPGEKQSCACVQVTGRAEDNELVCGSTGKVPNYCFATAVEEKRNKKEVELSGTIWSLAFKSAAQLTPCLSAQLAGVKQDFHRKQCQSTGGKVENNWTSSVQSITSDSLV